MKLRLIIAFLLGILWFAVIVEFGLSQEITVIEAETMTVSGTGNHKPVADGYCLLGPAKLSAAHEFKTTSVKIEIIARGDYAGDAWPILELSIGQGIYDDLIIDSATWKAFMVDATVSPGVFPITLEFINDYYVAPADRNVYIEKITIVEQAETGLTGSQSISFAWDPVTEENLRGYKIYWGKTSRKSVSGKIEAWCLKYEPNSETCLEEWKKICTSGDDFDQACHIQLFGYDGSVDVGNATERALSGFNEGEKYYFAATAYADATDSSLESVFSVELSHTFSFQVPDKPVKLSFNIPNTQ